MKAFIFNKKDTYTLSEVEDLMTQNTKFARKGYIEQTEELTTQLNDYKKMKEANEIAEFNKEITTKLEKNGVSNVEKILKYGKFDKEMDDKAFKSALKDLKADFPESFTEKQTIHEDDLKGMPTGDNKEILPPNIHGNIVG